MRATTAREIAALIASAPADELGRLCERYADDPRAQVRSAVESALRRQERERAEQERVGALYERMAELGGDGVVLGIDEVGRGPLAGPLTVCAVWLPPEPRIEGLNDSKKMSPSRREAVAARIAEVAHAIGIAHVQPESIDALGMAVALRHAMRQAIDDTGVDPDAVLIDGNPVHVHPRERCVVKGDATVACISAASIVAKVTRDALMVALDAEYPAYHFAENKGYGSAEHIAAIREHGLCPVHRASFCSNFIPEPTLF